MCSKLLDTIKAKFQECFLQILEGRCPSQREYARWWSRPLLPRRSTLVRARVYVEVSSWGFWCLSCPCGGLRTFPNLAPNPKAASSVVARPPPAPPCRMLRVHPANCPRSSSLVLRSIDRATKKRPNNLRNCAKRAANPKSNSRSSSKTKSWMPPLITLFNSGSSTKSQPSKYRKHSTSNK